MNEFVYYALRCSSPTAIAKATELGVNPESYNFRMFSTDPRYADYYLFVVIAASDGYVLNTSLITSTEEVIGNIDNEITIVN